MLLNRSAEVNICDLGVQLCRFCENLFELVSNLELRLQRDLMDDDLMTLTIDPESNIKKSEVQLKTNQLWSVDNEFVFRQSVQHEDNHVPVSLSKRKRKAAASFHDAVSLEGPRCSSVMLWRSVITRQPWPGGRNIFSTDQHIAKLMIHTIRNVGVVAHIDAGKTTTSEQMLFLGGQIKGIGRVDTGDTVMDFLPQERERGITISSSAISFPWKNRMINLIDTPGHVDFTIEVERSARVLDGVVVVIDAVSGVQAQTRTVWKQTKKQNIPAIAFVNKMDREGADFKRATDSIRVKLGGNAVPIQMPIGCESGFIGIVDLLSMSILLFDPACSSSRAPRAPSIEALTSSNSLYDSALSARKLMIESIAEVDDILMEKYLESDNEGIDLNPGELIPALRRACLNGDIVPTICGASLRCKGVEPLLDSIVTFLPSPKDRADSIAIDKKSGNKKNINYNDEALCALAFKVVHDPSRGSLVYLRIYSGVIEAKQMLYNSTRGVKERLNQLLSVNADDFVSIQSAGPGSVVCLVGLKGTFTGDTIVTDKGPLQTYVLDGLSIPEAVFSLTVEPEKASQQTSLESALAILCIEDPSLRVEFEKESGQTILRGIGELHLEIVCDKLRRQFNIEVETGRAYVNYREGISLEDGVIYKQFIYDRTFGPKRMFASLNFEVTPNEGSEEPSISISAVVKEAVTGDELCAIVDGLKASFSRGPQGFPVTGFHVSVVDVEKDFDTTPGAMRACVSLFIDSMLKGDRKMILEPIMAVEIELPANYLGDVLSDFTAKKRGQVKEIITLDGNSLTTVIGNVPLATMLGYATSIRSMTQGEGSFSMEYLTHSPVDQHIADEFLGSTNKNY